MIKIVHGVKVDDDFNNFPYYEMLKEKFDLPDNIIIAYKDVIFSRNPDKLTEDEIIHEKVHFDQQAEHNFEEYLKRYIENPNFRFAMEKEAYLKQLSSIQDPERKKRVYEKVLCDLSGPVYGNIISKEELSKILKI